MSWVEETPAQVDFLTRLLGLRGGERVLDLACGFGRHSIELARRGYAVTGVDITPAYIEYARATAEKENLSAAFVCADLREIACTAEFDVVLNLADGAIGYLENDAENLKIFDRIAAALKPGGKHVMEVCSGDYARKHFPRRHWEAGGQALSLAEFEWDAPAARMIYTGYTFPYGQPLVKPEGAGATSTRLYTLAELGSIFADRGMKVRAALDGYCDSPASDDSFEILVLSARGAGGK
ncbi:MAG: class I SAM-dependent methyltransferase [Chloroflexi bacterium]|nr:MAG: class I SAM-dependent methyltransferase [Chloroflexota bacterium]